MEDSDFRIRCGFRALPTCVFSSFCGGLFFLVVLFFVVRCDVVLFSVVLVAGQPLLLCCSLSFFAAFRSVAVPSDIALSDVSAAASWLFVLFPCSFLALTLYVFFLALTSLFPFSSVLSAYRHILQASSLCSENLRPFLSVFSPVFDIFPCPCYACYGRVTALLI